MRLKLAFVGLIALSGAALVVLILGVWFAFLQA